LGIAADDLVFLQATRILDRKGIELAIDTVAELGKDLYRNKLFGVSTAAGGVFSSSSRIILLCAGIVETIGISAMYWENLKNKAASLGVDLVQASEYVAHSRHVRDDGRKIYSLWDSYVASDFVTYPSVWEGWGNQFVEALFAKLPVLLFKYPVYISDLEDKQFEVISLGNTIAGHDEHGLVTVDHKIIVKCATEIVEVLTNPILRKHMVEHNYKMAKSHFSFINLEEYIDILLGNADI